MKFARENKDQILHLHNEGCSSYEIAEKLGTYSTKILRALKFLGAESRDYSTAQKNALNRGRSKIPTEKGTKPYRCHVRPPSFINLQTLPMMVEGSLVADLVAVIGTLDIVLGEIDR